MAGIFSILRKMLQGRKQPSVQGEKTPLGSELSNTLKQIKDSFGNSGDLVMREFLLGIQPSLPAAAVFIEGLTDSKIVNDFIMKSLQVEINETIGAFPRSKAQLFQDVKKHALSIANVNELSTMEDLLASLLEGKTVIIIQGCARVLAGGSSSDEGRSIEKPEIQPVLRGSQEAFTERLLTNTTLIRKRIKSSNLWLEKKKIGRVTQTDVAIMYIRGIANEAVIQEVHSRLDKIDTDAILESGYIENFIEDKIKTPFATIYNTERPDVVAANLLEGRVAILVDGTPFVLLVPVSFFQFFQAPDDYYQRFGFATRLLRYLAFAISLLTPSLYIAITTFHQDLIPTVLLVSLAAQREGVPFPAYFEALLMEITFEILREAGIRLPKPIGSAISIVGALVLGQAAVQASLVSPAMVMVVSLTAIANFVSPSVTLADAARYLRFPLMILASTFGIFGIQVGIIAIILHLCGLRSFGYPYMAPVAPLIPSDYKDTITVLPIKEMTTRPRLMSQRNRQRTELLRKDKE